MSGLFKPELKAENHDEIICPQIHPLIIPVIVRELVKFIGTKDLSKCRFVCKLWNEEIMRQMKIRSTFSFVLPGDLADFLMNGKRFFGFKNLKLEFGNNNTLADFGEWETVLLGIMASHGKSFKRVELNFHWAYPGSSFTLDIFRDIFLGSFQELEYLKLTKFPYAWTFGVLFPIGQPPLTLLKLTTIDFDVNAYHRIDRHHQNLNPDQAQEFYTQLLGLVPNLEEFHMTKSLNDGPWSASLTTCLYLLMDHSPTNLRRLYFHGRFLKHCALLLPFSTLNLQKLVFDNLVGFKVHFESGVSGSQINIMETLESEYEGVPAGEMKEFIETEAGRCEEGISCIQLLETFTSAYQDIIQEYEFHERQWTTESWTAHWTWYWNWYWNGWY